MTHLNLKELVSVKNVPIMNFAGVRENRMNCVTQNLENISFIIVKPLE